MFRDHYFKEREERVRNIAKKKVFSAYYNTLYDGSWLGIQINSLEGVLLWEKIHFDKNLNNVLHLTKVSSNKILQPLKVSCGPIWVKNKLIKLCFIQMSRCRLDRGLVMRCLFTSNPKLPLLSVRILTHAINQ